MGAVDAMFLVYLDRTGEDSERFSKMKVNLGFDQECSAPEIGAKVWADGEFSERIVGPLENFYAAMGLTIITEETIGGGGHGETILDLYAIGGVPSDVNELVTKYLVEIGVNRKAIRFGVNTPENVLFMIDLTKREHFADPDSDR